MAVITWTHSTGDTYLVTGTTVDGKRFRQVHSNWFVANGINLYRGRVYWVHNGKRKLVKTVWN